MSYVGNPLISLGGGGASSSVRGGFFVTVANQSGVVADYASISGAIASPFNAIYIIGDTVEPGQVQIPSSGLSIKFLNDASLNMGSSNFLWQDNAGVYIEGNGEIVSTAATLFDANGNSGRIDVKGITITTSSGTVLTDGTDGRFSDVILSSGMTISGTRNMIVSSKMQSLEIGAGSTNAIVSDSFVDEPIVDNGTGTILADIKEY